MAPVAPQLRVAREDVINHLRLLSSFRRLYQESADSLSLPPNRKPVMFLAHRAAYRLQLWLDLIADHVESGMAEPLLPTEIPPLDVALALHSMMLSPHRFFEDAQLRFPQLKRIDKYPFDLINPALSFEGPFYEPDLVKDAAKLWTQKTGLQYDPMESLRVDLTRLVVCPNCDAVVVAPWHTDDTHGFALRRHSIQTTLPFLKALSDYDAKRIPLPNTTDLASGELEGIHPSELSESIKDAILTRHNNSFPTARQVLAQALVKGQTGFDYITGLLESANLPLRPKQSVALILLPFRHSYPFTQDIVREILHGQRPLLSLEGDELLPKVQDSEVDFDFEKHYAEYASYLSSLKESPGVHRGPSLHIDLVWHTHMLKAETYRHDCLQLLGIFPNHVPRNELGGNTLEDAPDPDAKIVFAFDTQQRCFEIISESYRELASKATDEHFRDLCLRTAESYRTIADHVSGIATTWKELDPQRPSRMKIALAVRMIGTKHNSLASLMNELNDLEFHCQNEW
ncbi:hypothetical protein ONZ45_g12721 [Pleurotus djamor]|nr:hypothetical protein ONZ45_g12721 [Pleurotus djamor]